MDKNGQKRSKTVKNGQKTVNKSVVIKRVYLDPVSADIVNYPLL